MPITPRAASVSGSGLYENIRLYFQSKRFGRSLLCFWVPICFFVSACFFLPFCSVLPISTGDSFDCAFAVSAISAPRSQRFPVIKIRAPAAGVLNRLIVKRQLLAHLPQRESSSLTVSASSPSAGKIFDLTCTSAPCSFHWSRARSAAPKAPIRPLISGRTASLPVISSKARNTASL